MSNHQIANAFAIGYKNTNTIRKFDKFATRNECTKLEEEKANLSQTKREVRTIMRLIVFSSSSFR